ncbi:MAG TPA: methyltransferase domain-containing protein, partial [Ktedonobacteraceae bacterium]
MSNFADPSKKEHPSTYFVQDRQNEHELARLTVQDRMITSLMGGVLPEQDNTSRFRRILDVGSGSGSWAIETAQAYPAATVFGIDISQRMVHHAREQAVLQQVDERVEFHAMDALRMLEFPHNYFDLVNLRFGVSFMRTWDWPKLLGEMRRVTRPEGVVRLTDNEIVHESNSPSLTRFFEAIRRAMFRAGHLFEEENTGLTGHLADLLTRSGCEQIQTKAYALEFQGGTENAQAYYEDAAHAGRTLRPFMEKWGCLPADYDAIYQQALTDIQQSQFHNTWRVLT